MNIEDDNVDNVNNEDQSDFETLFFNGEPVQDEPDNEDTEEVEDSDQPGDEGEDLDPSATDETDDEDEDEPEEDVKPKGKNRKSAQERINELTAKARQEEREKLQLLKRLEELEAVVKKETVEKAPLKQDDLPEGAPDFDAVDEKGNLLYPLGEFDPKFIRDLTRFTIEQETKALREKEAQEAEQKAIQEVQTKIQSEWMERLEKYEEEVPEVRESIAELTEVFQDLNPTYGEYLASTIMASEFGPQIMHYLSDNIGEAQKIVASGPAAATLALGRLEARFIKPSNEKETKRNNKRVSDAPEPPESLTRGANGQFTVRPDTDDLSAFERVFFNNKK